MKSVTNTGCCGGTWGGERCGRHAVVEGSAGGEKYPRGGVVPGGRRGLYLFQDAGESGVRADRDLERSRFIDLAETEWGRVAVGSQSKGVLRFTAKTDHGGVTRQGQG